MRTALCFTAVLTLTILALSPAAEAGKRRKGGKGKGGKMAAPAGPLGNSPEQCLARRTMIQDTQGRYDDRRAELGGIDAEIRDLNRRLKELQEQRLLVQARVEKMSRKLPERRARWKQDCGTNETCDQYDRLTDQLEARQRPLEKQLDAVRDEIVTARKNVGGARNQMNSVKSEWDRLNCNSMQPGVTPIGTAKRCGELYHLWDQLQRQINANNSRIPALSSRYRAIAMSLDATEKQAATYETYMARNCTKSAKLVVVRRYRGVKDRANKLQAELDGLAREMASARGIKITVD